MRSSYTPPEIVIFKRSTNKVWNDSSLFPQIQYTLLEISHIYFGSAITDLPAAGTPIPNSFRTRDTQFKQ
jgi:hypothetical protein